MRFLFLLLLLSSTAFAKNITLTSSNTVTLRGPVMPASVGETIDKLKELSKLGDPQDPIYLVLNTPGGSVIAGIELIEYMNTLRRPVHAISIFAASMGFQILQNSHIRYVTKYAQTMSHQASIGGVEGNLPGQVQSRVDRVNKLIRKLDEQVVSRTKGKHTMASYTELVRDEYWGIGSNAINDGFADEVAVLKCDDSLNGTEDKIIQVAFFTAKIKLSKCPLITNLIVDKEENAQKVRSYFNNVRNFEI